MSEKVVVRTKQTAEKEVTRIVQQMEETTVVAVKSVEKKLENHLEAVDNSVSTNEVLGDLEIGCEECDTLLSLSK